MGDEKENYQRRQNDDSLVGKHSQGPLIPSQEL